MDDLALKVYHPDELWNIHFMHQRPNNPFMYRNTWVEWPEISSGSTIPLTRPGVISDLGLSYVLRVLEIKFT